MTIDSKKNIWICHFGGACITVYNLKGKRIYKIQLPAKNKKSQILLRWVGRSPKLQKEIIKSLL